MCTVLDSNQFLSTVFDMFLQTQLASLAPLRVPRKPVGVASKTGHVEIGNLPEDTPGKTQLSKLARQTASLLAVSLQCDMQNMFVLNSDINPSHRVGLCRPY